MGEIKDEGIEMCAHRSLDMRVGKIVNDQTVPFDSKDEALESPYVTEKSRYRGLTVMVWNSDKTVINDWQFIAGIEDDDLVLKPGGGGTPVTADQVDETATKVYISPEEKAFLQQLKADYESQ